MQPQIQSNKTDLPFTGSDILFDWHPFDIPKGANLLQSATVVIAGNDGAANTARDFYVYFAKSDKFGNAPASLGTGNAQANTITGGFQNQLLGGFFSAGATSTIADGTQLKVTGMQRSYMSGGRWYGT